jgi:phospholipase/lecithinase/hemolysin
MCTAALTRAVRLLSVGGLLVAAGCVGGGDALLPARPPADGGPLFQRYVALGNSFTAGYISGGITAATQRQSYANLLAMRAGIQNWGMPLLAAPGCPPPFTAPLTPSGLAPSCQRLEGAAGNPLLVQNLAVPGAHIADLFRIPPGTLGQLHTLLVGHRTQAEAMVAARPSFVSVWIGNNDALAASVGGVLGPPAAGADSALTPLAQFQTRVDQLVAALRASGASDVLLVGVVDAVTAVPLLQPGAYFFAARDAQGAYQGKPVNVNCSPITALGQQNPLAANMVSFQILGDTRFPEINCDPNAYAAADLRRGVYLLDTQEQVIVRQRVQQFNAALATAAAANGWMYQDPNQILAPMLTQPNAQGRFDFVRKCQLLASATTPLALQTAVLNSCPVTGPTAAPNFFGSLISFDGVHPSAAAHTFLAGTFAAAINARHGTTLSTATN